MTFPQVLVHLGDWDAEQLGDAGQIVGGFVGVQNVVAGRNPAHRHSVRPSMPQLGRAEHRFQAELRVAPTMSLVADDPLEGMLLDGRYRVATKIATGGTSTVYRGLDTRLDRPVALKVMDSRYAGDQQFLTRFQLEARTVARLKDPGLVAVYDQGLDARHPFLVMELVEGGTLRELLSERGPMPPHAVAAVLRPVLGGLAAAHRAGLVHRDVKPENVLISDEGDVKIVDFGLVRAVAAAGITSTSVILGTAAYLSPEQVRDGNASPRSDVYAVGIMAYELLTGQTPFSGDSALSVAYQRLDTDVPAPSTMIDGVPAAIRRAGTTSHGARSRRPLRRRAGNGRRIGRDRRRAGAPRISGAHAAQLRSTPLSRAASQPDRPKPDHGAASACRPSGSRCTTPLVS